MSCPCLYDPRNVVIDKPQIPRPVRQVSRTNNRAPLPGGLRRSSSGGSTRSMTMTTGLGVSMGISEKTLEKPSNHTPKSILKHPTPRFPFEDPVAVQRATGLRFEVGKLSSEFTLDPETVQVVQATKRRGRQPRDSMVVVDEARTRARRRFLAEKESREALLAEESE